MIEYTLEDVIKFLDGTETRYKYLEDDEYAKVIHFCSPKDQYILVEEIDDCCRIVIPAESEDCDDDYEEISFEEMEEFFNN